MSVRLIPIIVLVVVGLLLLVWRQTWSEPTVVSGYIEADEVGVGSRIGGRIKEVLVVEGSVVAKDQVLARLDPYNLNELLAQAKADQASAEAKHLRLKRGFRVEEIAEAKAQRNQSKAALDEAVAGPRKQQIDSARDQVELSKAELKLAEQNFARIQQLVGVNASSRENLDQATSQLSVARARVEATQADLNLLQEGTRKEQIEQAQAKLDAVQARLNLLEKGYREEEITEAKAASDSAQARVESIAKQIDELEILAPLDSVVDATDLKPGDLTAPNVPVIKLTLAGNLYIRAYVPEKWIGWLKVGQETEIGIDSFPERTFKGRVIFIADQAEFTPSNVQTPDERSQQVYRIKVKLEGDLSPFRAGMAADIRLSKPSLP